MTSVYLIVHGRLRQSVLDIHGNEVLHRFLIRGSQFGVLGAAQAEPATLQTVLRSFLVQSVNMNSVGVQPADVVIEPDVTRFDLSEFSRTDEIAAVGETTAQQAIPEIGSLLRQLDDKLFSGV